MVEEHQNRFECKGIMREYIRDPAANASIVARIEGEIKEEDLKEALKKVRKLHPLLGVRLVLDKNYGAWFTDKDVPPIPLKIINRESNRHWIEIVTDEINIYSNLEEDPLIRFILLKSSEVSDIIVICNHIICDGMSLVNLVRDILFFLSKPELKKVKEIETVLPTSDYFPSKSLLFRLELLANKVYFGIANRRWDKQKILFNELDYHYMCKAFNQKYRYRILDTELSCLQTSSLIDQCRQNHVTVNSALSVAFLAASYDIRGENGNNNIEVGVNIRNEFNRPAEDVFGFLASCINLEFEYNPKITFWENVSSFHKKILPALKENEIIKNYIMAEYIDPTLMDAIKFAMYCWWVSKDLKSYEKLSSFLQNENNIAVDMSKQRISSMPHLSMSNMGKINFPSDYGSLKLDGLYIATNSLPSLDLAVGAVTFDGKLTLTLNFMEDDASDKSTIEMQNILKRTTEYLNNTVENS